MSTSSTTAATDINTLTTKPTDDCNHVIPDNVTERRISCLLAAYDGVFLLSHRSAKWRRTSHVSRDRPLAEGQVRGDHSVSRRREAEPETAPDSSQHANSEVCRNNHDGFQCLKQMEWFLVCLFVCFIPPIWHACFVLVKTKQTETVSVRLSGYCI